MKAAGPTVANSLTLNDDLSATLPFYGGGTYTGTEAFSLSVDSSGNVIEVPVVKVYAAKVTKPGASYVLVPAMNTTGGTITISYDVPGAFYTITSSNNAFTTGKTFAFGTLEISTDGSFTAFEASTSQLNIQTVSTGSPSGFEGLLNSYIKIEIYP